MSRKNNYVIYQFMPDHENETGSWEILGSTAWAAYVRSIPFWLRDIEAWFALLHLCMKYARAPLPFQCTIWEIEACSITSNAHTQRHTPSATRQWWSSNLQILGYLSSSLTHGLQYIIGTLCKNLISNVRTMIMTNFLRAPCCLSLCYNHLPY